MIKNILRLLFKNKDKTTSTVSKQLTYYYKKEKYDVIPYIPSNEVADALLRKKEFYDILFPHKDYMTFITNDKLIFGHIIMLWWLSEVKRKRIPDYFLYEYGIDFDKELYHLKRLEYLDKELNLTKKGELLLKNNSAIIRKHRADKLYKKSNIEYIYKDAEAVAFIKDFISNGDYIEDQRLGSSFEKAKDYQNAILAYKSAIINAKAEDDLVPPNPYFRLAIIYRKLKMKDKEISILKEGIKATSYPGAKVTNRKMRDRLNKLINKN